jgi:hypothetical protein
MMFRPWRGSFGSVISWSLRMRVWPILLLGISLVACSPQQNAAKPPDPEAVLQAIPAADPAQFERFRDMKKWRNPYLIVRPDGVALLDTADSAEIILKPTELLPALANLPASNWPYGRVVAATENSVRASEQDGVAIRRNKGIVGGMLEGAHVAVKWVPTA